MIKKLILLLFVVILSLSIRVREEQQHDIKIWNRSGRNYKEVCSHYRGVFCPGPVEKVTGKCCNPKHGSTDTCGHVGCAWGIDTMSITDMKWDY